MADKIGSTYRGREIHTSWDQDLAGGDLEAVNGTGESSHFVCSFNVWNNLNRNRLKVNLEMTGS